MKYLLLLVSLTLFSGCGTDSSSPVVTDDSPQVQVPVNALISDYSCEERNELTDASGPDVFLASFQGVASDWKEGDVSVNFEVDNDGNYQSLVKSRKTDLGNQQFRTEGEAIDWTKRDNVWFKEVRTYERLWQKEG